jgi:Na+-transporting methylmalonyl-CoA/oxaloacetate decarboxylase gamma subunit
MLLIFFLVFLAISAMPSLPSAPMSDVGALGNVRAVSEDAEVLITVSWYYMGNNGSFDDVEAQYLDFYEASNISDLYENDNLASQYLVNSFESLWRDQVDTFMQLSLEKIGDVPGNTEAGLRGYYLRQCAQLFNDPALFKVEESVKTCSEAYGCISDSSDPEDLSDGNCNNERYGCIDYLSYVFDVSFIFPTDCPVGEYDPAVSGFLVVKTPAELVTDILAGYEGGELENQFNSRSLLNDGKLPFVVTFYVKVGESTTFEVCGNTTCPVVTDILHSVEFLLSSANSPQDLRNLPDPEDGDKDNSDNTAAIVGGVVGGVLGLLLLCAVCLFGPCVIVGVLVVIVLVVLAVLCVFLLLVVLILAIVMVILGTLLRIFVYSKRKPPQDEAADLHGWSDEESGSGDGDAGEDEDL